MNSDTIQECGRRLPWVRTLQVASLAWLLFVAAFVLGYAVNARRVWPYAWIHSIVEYILGTPEEENTVREKLEHDLGLLPSRFLVTDPLARPSGATLSELAGLSFNPRRTATPRVFLSPRAPRGYRMVSGVFDFVDTLHGAVLLDPAGKVAHVWRIRMDPGMERRAFPFGMELLPDGSIIVAFTPGQPLTRYGWGGDVIWRCPGNFHHSVALGDDGVVWSWDEEAMVAVRAETGEVLRRIEMLEVMARNPDIDIFGIRQKDGAQNWEWVHEGGSYWHVNDVEPLRREWAGAYPGFAAGDLLLSLRSLNLIFVLNPETLQVKWWRQGATRRQHDPDFNARGTITVFDNNMHRGFSRITEIDPRNQERRVLLPGGKFGFYTWMRGAHDEAPGGGLLVASAQQGRVFEVDGAGEQVFELLNDYDASGRRLVVSDVRFLELDYFTEGLLPK